MSGLCITNFNVRGDLPGRQVYDIFQVINGNKWIATDRGLDKYNGFEFTLFYISNGLFNQTRKINTSCELLVYQRVQDDQQQITNIDYKGYSLLALRCFWCSYLKSQDILLLQPICGQQRLGLLACFS